MPNSLNKVSDAAKAVDAASEALHASIREAFARGDRAVDIAAACGLSRQRIYQLVGAEAAKRRKIETRLAELDARWNALVDTVAEGNKPPGATGNGDAGYITVQTAKRNARRGIDARAGRPQRPSVLDETRAASEAQLLRVLHNNVQDPRVAVVVREIAEANTLRQLLEASNDSLLGI